MDLSDNDVDRHLYRVEYYEPADGQNYIEWVWLAPDELTSYMSSYSMVKFRPATHAETDLYNEAYADGYSMAAAIEFKDNFDGVSYRLIPNEDGTIDGDLRTEKMFSCAMCEDFKDFETEVAMASGMYLGNVKDDKLWHLCYECAMAQMEIDDIAIEIDWESDDVPDEEEN